MQAESIASCANNSSGHPVTRSRGVSCRRCRAASACSSYLRATSTAVIHAHARAKRSEAYAGTHHSTMMMCLQLCAEGQKDLPARGHRENVSGMAFSHRLQDRAAQQHGRSAWLSQRLHARNVYSRSASKAWQELCRHTATRYWRKECVRSTRATPPHALTITLACPHSSAWPSRGQI